jgi:trk system potassium uptake protein TrkH
MSADSDGKRVEGLLSRAVVSLSSFVLIVLLLKEGYELIDQPSLEILATVGISCVVFLSVLWDVLVWRRSADAWSTAKRLAPQCVLLIPIVLFSEKSAIWGLSVFLRQGIVVVVALSQTARFRRYMDQLQARPAKIFVLSFVLVIGIGALVLTFPRATVDGLGAKPIDAVFTSTSATCVTGLATLNTVDDAHAATDRQSFTPFGQFVILILIQIGGLGIMTLSAATVMIAGSRLAMKSRALMQSILDEHSAQALRKTVRDIFLMTFVIEGVGAALLTLRFWQLDYDLGRAVWLGTFHAISAFCNAGFSLFGDSLMSFRDDWVINGVHMALILLGGLGFAVVTALAARRTWSGGFGVGWRRLSLQIRLVVTVTLMLIVAGTIFYFYLEYDRSLKGLDVGEKLLASLFHSVSFRTAGFNSVDMGEMSRAMMILSCVFMFIGACPGSTGGGIKTSTVAVLFMSIRASMTSQADVEIGKHTVNPKVVTRAISIVAIAFSFLIVGLVLLVLTQPDIPLEALLFESVSALGTVGLSLGITPDLDGTGKVIIILLMFVGRLGPLTIALAVGERQTNRGFRYSEERIVVG